MFETTRENTWLVRGVGRARHSSHRAMTPPIGGFYKQMVTEQVRLPMLMLRSHHAIATRFACLLESIYREPFVSAFEKGNE